MNQRIDYEVIRQRVDETLARQRQRSKWGLFIANVLLFLCFVGGLAMLTVFDDMAYYLNEFSLMGFVMLSLGWGIGVLLHGITTLMDHRWLANRSREAVTRREIQKELARMGMDEFDFLDKPKRTDRLALNEEGELVEAWDEQPTNQRTAR